MRNNGLDVAALVAQAQPQEAAVGMVALAETQLLCLVAVQCPGETAKARVDAAVDLIAEAVMAGSKAIGAAVARKKALREGGMA